MSWLLNRFEYILDRLEVDDYTMIIKNLYLGNKNSSKLDILQDLKIDIVINVNKVLPFYNDNIKNIRIPVDDDKSLASVLILSQYTQEIIPYIHKQLQKEKRILIHCREGIQRSPTIIAAYLMKYRGMSMDEAIEYIQHRRPISFRPTHNFRKTLEILEKMYKYF